MRVDDVAGTLHAFWDEATIEPTAAGQWQAAAIRLAAILEPALK